MDDLRECPATMALAGSWVVVFVAMHLFQAQWGHAPPSSLLGPWPVGGEASHYFGAQSWGEIRRGEVWRALTATFLHGSLIHLGLNLLGLVQLGRLIEPWYRSGPFLAACLAIGGLGNLLSGLMRQGMVSIRPAIEGSAVARLWPNAVHQLFGGPPGGGVNAQSLGGSTILLGLMGLILVVGWRSRTRMGSYLRDQMAILLIATALLGAFLPQYIDNYGHAGGAIVGILLGFVHRPLLRLVEARWFRRAAWAGSIALVAWCATAQARDAFAEIRLNRRIEAVTGRLQAEQTVLPLLPNFSQLYARDALRAGPEPLDEWAIRDWFGIPPTAPSPGEDPGEEARQAVEDHAAMAKMLPLLESIPIDLWGPDVAGEFARLRELGRRSLQSPPTYAETFDFATSAGAVIRALSDDNERSASENARLRAGLQQP
ncbi:rhomboid family intramembrane serine protease [Tundrisphaera sp. TA3]|uniref:rhomboid family intramembrane serine protease n=1 Tax=Tundrisphaera sp. TA3 TaxID=3435775 RepID=UPI003EBF40AD